MKRFFITLAVLAGIIFIGYLLQEFLGGGGIGLAAVLGVIAGEIGLAKIVRPDED